MAFRDGKKSRDEREKARREERRKALSARLGGRPDQPGRSESEREATKRRSETPKPVAKDSASDAPETGRAPEATSKTAGPSGSPRKEPARRERKPKRRFWQRGAKPKTAARPARRRPEPESPKADKPKAAGKARGHDRRKPARSKRRGPSRQERVKALRTRGGSAAKTGGKALRDGAAATRRRAKAAKPKVAAAGRQSWTIAAPILALPFLALAFAQRWFGTGLRAGGRALSAATAFLDRHVTPARAVLLVAVVTSVCLIVSQFQDYRGVEVGQPGYVEVAGTVSADQVDLQTPRDAHGPWLLILGGLAIVAAVAAIVTRRRALGLVVSAVGAAGLLVGLIGDRPEGLDEGSTAVAYAGTNAILLDGFYAQVAACGVLIAAGLLIALYAGAPARSREKSPRRAKRRKTGTRPRRPVAGGDTVAESGP